MSEEEYDEHDGMKSPRGCKSVGKEGGCRSFTIVKVTDNKGKPKGKDNLGGRFISRNPGNAAKKAGSQICRNTKVHGQCSLIITIKETTQNSNKKEFSYKFRRINEPVTVTYKNGSELTFNYKTICTSHK